MAVAAPGWCIPYWWSQQNGGRLQFVSNSCFAAAVKTSGGDFVEVNKIGRNTHFHNVKRTDYKFPAKNIGTILEKVHKKLSNVREHRRRKF